MKNNCILDAASAQPTANPYFQAQFGVDSLIKFKKEFIDVTFTAAESLQFLGCIIIFSVQDTRQEREVKRQWNENDDKLGVFQNFA